MKIAVVGVGFRAVKVLNYLYAAMPEAKIVGYCDPNPILLNDLEIPCEDRAFETAEALLEGTQPDLLFVASPNHLHLEHIRAGLEAGVKVFAEKPLVSSIEQTWQLCELLQKHGEDNLMVGLVLRYSQHIVDLQKAMSDGKLGKIVSMEANEHIGPYHGAFFMRDWRRHSAYSGGFMLEKCCHDLDLYSMIAGSRPVRVASFGGRSSFVPENTPAAGEDATQYHVKSSIWEGVDDPFQVDGDVVDNQTALIQYENGVSMAFHANLHSPDIQRRFVVHGTHGMAEGEFQKGYLKVFNARTCEQVIDVDYKQMPDAHLHHYGADARMGKLLTEYMRGGTQTLPVSARNALEAGVVALKIDEARKAGEMVDLTETWARFDSYGLKK